MLELIRRDPRQLGSKRSRWTLGELLSRVGWLRLGTLSGLQRLLARLGISYKRGRDYVHSPDPDYEAKCTYIERIKQLVAASGGKQVLVYLDEVTLYRQPSLACAYEARGHEQALARRSYQANSLIRVVASLDHHSGQVVYLRSTKVGIKQLVDFYQQLRKAYPQAERIYVVQDNWPVHFHPYVKAVLEAQDSPFEPKLSPYWDKVKVSAKVLKAWGELDLPIQLVALPTYASWLNPIEKLWRKLKQERLHLHRLADQWEILKQELDTFLEQFKKAGRESSALLHYVGLHTL